ncbi:ESX secretion-associated protein EspG [Amycolatopsis nigrescens]|uniref:ESX secretion-associated protein EspG n=1 Tax=Amycolatopsis nigrescens TaxID=381445 RepID=UPI000369AF17
MQLPVGALAGLAEQERAGALHVVLRPEPLWLSDDEKLHAKERMQQALGEAGLVDGRGRIEVDFLDWLPLLTTPSLEYYGWANDGERTFGVLAAARGLQGIIAIRSGDGVAIRTVRRDRLPESLVAELPEVAPGAGRPLMVRIAELEEAGRRTTTDMLPPPAIRELVKVLQRPVEGTGELYAGRRDEVGRYTRLEQPLHYADTDWGRYLNYTVGSGDDAEVHLAPGHPNALVNALLKLEHTLDG